MWPSCVWVRVACEILRCGVVELNSCSLPQKDETQIIFYFSNQLKEKTASLHMS